MRLLLKEVRGFIALLLFVPALLLMVPVVFFPPRNRLEEDKLLKKWYAKPAVWCIATLFKEGDISKVRW